MKNTPSIIGCLVSAVVTALLIISLNISQPIPKHCPCLITQLELQERLVELGYVVEVDGKAGPDTRAAWEQWEWDEFNKRILRRPK